MRQHQFDIRPSSDVRAFDRGGPHGVPYPEPRSCATDEEVEAFFENLHLQLNAESKKKILVPPLVFRQLEQLDQVRMLSSNFCQDNRDNSSSLVDADKRVMLCQNPGFVEYSSQGSTNAYGRYTLHLGVVYYVTVRGDVISCSRSWVKKSKNELTETLQNGLYDIIGFRRDAVGWKNYYLQREFRILRSEADRYGYKYVQLSDESGTGHQSKEAVAVMVLGTFDRIRPYSDQDGYYVVDHKVARDNNCLENLEWVSVSTNNSANRRHSTYVIMSCIVNALSALLTTSPYLQGCPIL